MRLAIVESSRFKKSLKRVRKQKKLDEFVFIQVINSLADMKKLDGKYRDHQLTGNLRHFRECHLAPDLLLVYRVKDNELVLALFDIGSHAHLFNK